MVYGVRWWQGDIVCECVATLITEWISRPPHHTTPHTPHTPHHTTPHHAHDTEPRHTSARAGSTHPPMVVSIPPRPVPSFTSSTVPLLPHVTSHPAVHSSTSCGESRPVAGWSTKVPSVTWKRLSLPCPGSATTTCWPSQASRRPTGRYSCPDRGPLAPITRRGDKSWAHTGDNTSTLNHNPTHTTITTHNMHGGSGVGPEVGAKCLLHPPPHSPTPHSLSDRGSVGICIPLRSRPCLCLCPCPCLQRARVH